VISPYARINAVDHTLTDQTSILRFIEDNWSLGRIGEQSADALAGPLDGMFDFRKARAQALILDPKTGQPAP
jgi:phospholipase C